MRPDDRGDSGARRLVRRLRAAVMDRVLGFGAIREGVAVLRRDTDVLLHRVQQLGDRLDATVNVLERRLGLLDQTLDEAKLLVARALISNHATAGSVAEAEFRVFSQWGQDGIIQFLLRHTDVRERAFVEFGVEAYRESNTRFLLINDNWRGLVLDGSPDNIAAVRSDPVSWRHDLTAVAAIVDAGNINALLASHGMAGEIGLLSIDIDGNDYWVWKAITEVHPTIVVVEYNSVFGMQHPVAVPYDPGFFRTAAHHSNLYFGASLPALVELGRSKGYAFVGSTSAGNDAFFVRRDRMRSGLREMSVQEGYVASRFRESRDEHGNLTYLSGPERLHAIAGMPLVNVVTGERLRAGQLV